MVGQIIIHRAVRIPPCYSLSAEENVLRRVVAGEVGFYQRVAPVAIPVELSARLLDPLAVSIVSVAYPRGARLAIFGVVDVTVQAVVGEISGGVVAEPEMRLWLGMVTFKGVENEDFQRNTLRLRFFFAYRSRIPAALTQMQQALQLTQMTHSVNGVDSAFYST